MRRWFRPPPARPRRRARSYRVTGGTGAFTTNRAGIRQAMDSLGGGQGACLATPPASNRAGLRLEAGSPSRTDAAQSSIACSTSIAAVPAVPILGLRRGHLPGLAHAPASRILIAASARGRVSYGAKVYERYVNFDRCLMGALDAGAATWADAFSRALPCVQERERGLGVRPSEPQAYFGAQVANLAVPGAPPLSARLR